MTATLVPIRPHPDGAAGVGERSVIVDGLRMRGRAWTSQAAPAEPAVVLVHGLVVAGAMCAPTAERLAARHHVYVPDLPGCGLSDKPPRAYGVAEHGRALARWLDGLGLSATVLAATSFGCQVAVETAVRRPDLVAGLVLAGPTVDRHARGWSRQLARWVAKQRTQSLRLRALMARDYARAGPIRAAQTFAAAMADPVEDKLPETTQPAVVARGSRDPVVSPRWAREVAAALPAGEFVTVPGAVHNMAHDNPVELSRIVAGFVRRLHPGR